MNMTVLNLMAGQWLAFGAPTPPGTESTAPGFMSFMPLILMFVVFYFLLIRPQMKKQKETDEMIRNVKSGDSVITVGGMHGTITNVKEKSVILKISDNVKIELEKTGIVTVIREPEKADKK